MTAATIGKRLHAIRSGMSLNATKMAELVELRARQTWELYERGVRLPECSVLIRLAELRYNVNWILTGEGGMMLGDIVSAPATIDSNALAATIVVVDEMLAQQGVSPPAKDRAELIVKLYEIRMRDKAKEARPEAAEPPKRSAAGSNG